MDAPVRHADAASLRRQDWHLPVLFGLLALALPTLITLAREEWSREAGVHEPLVIATAIWLIWRDLQQWKSLPRPGSPAISAALLLPSLIAYVFGRSFDYLILEAAGLYGAALACGYSILGGAILKRLWFPLFYLLFALPFPGWLLDFATSPLKHLCSALTTHLLQLFGVPILREGVTLFVAQYQLLVEDACAGLNAILGLTSLGLFYAYLQHGASWRYSAALFLFIIPIAIVANVVRISILVLITLWAGNEAAQSYLHGAAGLVTFAAGLFLVFILDSVLSRTRFFRAQD